MNQWQYQPFCTANLSFGLSPHPYELMVQSLIGMPFNKHNKELQTIYSKNPFLEGVLHTWLSGTLY
jgi:hypothetical protein